MRALLLKKPLWLVSLAVAVCLLAGCAKEASQASGGVKPDGQRKPAPDFTLKDAYGQTVHLSDYRGKVVLLAFWATWCGPCKVEIPWFIDLERTQKDKGFAVLGVSMDDDGWPVVKPFVSQMGMNYRVLMGNDETAQLYGGISSLPTSFLIDRSGRIAAVHIALGRREEIEDEVKSLLQSSGPQSGDRSAIPASPAGAE
jgi:peroxiredoxin